MSCFKAGIRSCFKAGIVLRSWGASCNHVCSDPGWRQPGVQPRLLLIPAGTAGEPLASTFALTPAGTAGEPHGNTFALTPAGTAGDSGTACVLRLRPIYIYIYIYTTTRLGPAYTWRWASCEVGCSTCAPDPSFLKATFGPSAARSCTSYPTRCGSRARHLFSNNSRHAADSSGGPGLSIRIFVAYR